MPRTSRFRKQFHTFFGAHSRLFLFLTLVLSGVVAGCLWYSRLPVRATALLSTLCQGGGGFAGFFGAITAFFRNSLVTLAAVGLLMLAGMSLCGLPVSLAVPFFYGAFTGFCEVALLKDGGVTALLLSLPGTLLAVWTMLIACAESLRLTLRLVSQVMPGSQKAGLWRDFRLFFRRFLLCFLLALLASAVGTTLSLLF